MVKAPLNPRPTQVALPKAIWVTWLISLLLLVVVGGTLFLFPGIAQYYWPWSLAPFNTRFLGAIYSSAAIPLVTYVNRPSLDKLRIILPIFASITTYFLLVSVGYSESFLDRKTSAIWFFLYGADSFVGLFYCWVYRQQLIASKKGLYSLSSYSIQAFLLGLYGLGLLVAAPLFGQWWPWPLDAFHSHLYSGVFLTAAFAMVWLGDRASRSVQVIFGITQLCLGGGIALGNWVVDRQVHKLDWTSVSPWLWQAVFLGFAGLGGWIVAKNYAWSTKILSP